MTTSGKLQVLLQVTALGEHAKNVRITVFENEDSFSQEVWDELYALSTDTFVEENEKLKSTAAGAGLEDND